MTLQGTVVHMGIGSRNTPPWKAWKPKINTRKYGKDYAPEKKNRYQKWWCGKCISFQTWLFWGAMLDFKGEFYVAPENGRDWNTPFLFRMTYFQGLLLLDFREGKHPATSLEEINHPFWCCYGWSTYPHPNVPPPLQGLNKGLLTISFPWQGLIKP